MSGFQAGARDEGWIIRPWEPPSGDEVLAANASAAGLYLAGAALCATGPLLPHLESLAAVTAVGVTAVATASALLLAVRARRGGLGLALAVELWGVFLIAVAVAATGGASSPLGEGGATVESMAVAADARVAEQLERIAGASPLTLSGRHPVAEVLRTGTPYMAIASSEEDFERLARNAEHRELIARFGGEAVAVLPVLARGRPRARRSAPRRCSRASTS